MNNGVNIAINVFGADAANSYYIDGNIGYKVCSNGNMIIRPSSTTDESTGYALTVKGNVSVSGTVTESSDERLKDKIDDKIYSVEDFANAPLFTYTWI